MPTKAAVSSAIQPKANLSAQPTATAHRIFTVKIAIASAHARICSADQTLSANPRIMLDGVDAELDTQKDKVEIVSHVS